MKTSHRILYFSSQFPTPAWPQMGMFSLQRVRALRNTGSEVMVVCPAFLTLPRRLMMKPVQAYQWIMNQVQVPDKACIQGVHVYYPKWIRPPAPLFGWYTSIFLFWQIRKGVLKLAKGFVPEMIISSWLPDGVAACQLGEMLNIPTVSIADGSDVNHLPHQWPGWKYARDILNEKTAALIYVSEALRTEGDANGLHGRKNVVIHNAVDVEFFRPNLLPRDDGVFTILGVGRLVPVKGFHILLDAFAELYQRLNRQARLILVGDGPLRSALIRQAANLGIAPSVEFAGAIKQEELVSYYQKSDVLCVPSFSEGSPTVVVEGMACGNPVVASQVGGVGEIVDPQSGILVPPGNPELLCEALLQARNRVWDGKTIRQKMVDGFEWGKWTQTVLQLVDSTLS